MDADESTERPPRAARVAGWATQVAIVLPVSYLLLTAGAVTLGDGPVPWLEVALIVAGCLVAGASMAAGGRAMKRGSRPAIWVGFAIATLLLVLALGALVLSRWSTVQALSLIGFPSVYTLLYWRALRAMSPGR